MINTNFKKGHMGLVATILGGSGLEPPPKHVGQSSSFSLGYYGKGPKKLGPKKLGNC